MTKEELSQFLQDNMDLIAEENLEKLYAKFPLTKCIPLTQFFLEHNIDPLMYMKHIPDRYLYKGSDTDKVSFIPKILILPNNIQGIGSGAFLGCSEIEELYIPSSVTYINCNVFYGCKSIEEVVLPNSVVGMGSAVFENCTALQKVSLSENLTVVESHTFANCTSLKEIVIPEKVVAIHSMAFRFCESLERVVIGSNVATIDERAFGGCSKLETILYNGTKEQWKKIKRHAFWKTAVPATTVKCTDGAMEMVYGA